MKRSSSVQFGVSAGRAIAVRPFVRIEVLHEGGAQRCRGEWSDHASQLNTASAGSTHTRVFPSPPLVARVLVAPVPDDRPCVDRRIRGTCPRRRRGRIVDWRLDRDEWYGAADLMAYAEWRSSWERTWELGPLANLRSLHRIVGALEDVPSVVALLGALVADPEAARIEPSQVPGLPRRARCGARGDRRRTRRGDQRSSTRPRASRATVGFSRTWGTPAEPLLLAANSATGVIVDPIDGLVVVARATGVRRIADVVDVDLRGDVVVVTNRHGESIALEGTAARPVAWIVPTSLRWKVRSIPQVVVWSALFSRLPDALRVASAMDQVVSFSIDRDS